MGFKFIFDVKIKYGVKLVLSWFTKSMWRQYVKHRSSTNNINEVVGIWSDLPYWIKEKRYQVKFGLTNPAVYSWC